MDFSEHTDDQLADVTKALVDEIEGRIAALPTGALKTAASLHMAKAHKQLNKVRELTVDEGLIQPFSGGTPKGP